MIFLLWAPAALAAAENAPENPHTGDADSTAECYAWAADGQCVANPSFMLSSCKYSCWEWYQYRKKKYPDAPIDKAFDCHGWGQAGECSKNPSFMHEECPETCKDKGYGDESPGTEAPVAKKKKKKTKKEKGKKAVKEEL